MDVPVETADFIPVFLDDAVFTDISPGWDVLVDVELSSSFSTYPKRKYG